MAGRTPENSIPGAILEVSSSITGRLYSRTIGGLSLRSEDDLRTLNAMAKRVAELHTASPNYHYDGPHAALVTTLSAKFMPKKA